jgi:Rhodopirellula transposase DDE domain
VAQPPLEATLRALWQEYTAGDPMREGVLWTNLSLREWSRRLVALGPPARRRTIRRLLSKRKVGRRTARKKKTMGPHPDRNAPCENIARLRRAYAASGEAVIAIDTKKTALLGNFHRAGTPVTVETVETFDHDVGSASQGKLMPHGIYDMVHHQAHMHLHTSHDTSALCCDSVAWWWEQAGRTAYPRAKRLLVLGDGGGSNSATPYRFKEDLQGLANRLGLEMRVAHYPPYCAKYTPLEHRGFPHVTRACQGVLFHTVDVAPHFIERTKTTTALGMTVRILDKVYETGRKYAADFKQNMQIIFDDHLPKWNYRAVPECT